MKTTTTKGLTLKATRGKLGNGIDEVLCIVRALKYIVRRLVR